jgi:hypothetical protein
MMFRFTCTVMQVTDDPGAGAGGAITLRSADQGSEQSHDVALSVGCLIWLHL